MCVCVCVSGCGVGVPHPIGGSALVNLVLVVHLRGGPPGIGFWSIRIQWMVSESGAKNDGFWWSGTGLGIGSHGQPCNLLGKCGELLIASAHGGGGGK